MLGTYFAVAAIASLTGLPIQGAITGSGDDLTGLIAFSGVAMVVGAAGLAGAMAVLRKKRNAEK